jgi:hypothetical protein
MSALELRSGATALLHTSRHRSTLESNAPSTSHPYASTTSDTRARRSRSTPELTSPSSHVSAGAQLQPRPCRSTRTSSTTPSTSTACATTSTASSRDSPAAPESLPLAPSDRRERDVQAGVHSKIHRLHGLEGGQVVRALNRLGPSRLDVSAVTATKRGGSAAKPPAVARGSRMDRRPRSARWSRGRRGTRLSDAT